jgi:hypothetical protein
MLQQIRGELFRAVVRRLEARRHAVAALEELALERRHEIVDIFVVDE